MPHTTAILYDGHPFSERSTGVIVEKNAARSVWMPIILLFIAIGASKYLQSQTISELTTPASMQGVVTAKTGQPLNGVKVSTIPYYNAAFTDQQGRFNITVSRFTKSLQLTKAGFETRVIKLKNHLAPLRIQMEKVSFGDSAGKVAALQDMVVVGYGKNPPGAVTGSQITGPEIKAIGGTGAYRKMRTKQQTFAGLSPGYVSGLNNNYYNDAESYAHQTENGFKSAEATPLSTFSIDVDKASYSNIRRFIDDGILPPADAVRIEELVNYFDYHYPQPTGKDPVKIHTEISTAPWNPDHYLLQIGLQAKKVAATALPASNLVFLIDVSGSMASSNKLPLLISSFKILTDQLREQDYVSIVTYAGNAQDVLAPTSGADKATIKTALDKLSASGSTNGAGGLEKAYAMAEKHFKKGGNNRIILASDGDFNVGPSGLQDLEELITTKRTSGIFLSVLGFGMGNYKDDKMETLADKGNGNYAYIDNSAEARRVLLKEFGGTLFTVAKDVKVQIEFNPAVVQAYRLVGYENRALNDADFNQDSVDAGEMGSGAAVTALYEIIPQGIKDSFAPDIDTLRYVSNRLRARNALNEELARIKIRYKQPDNDKSKLISQIITNKPADIKNTSTDFQLAAAAAGWGMLLKNSAYKQQITYSKVAGLIKKPLGSDQNGQVGGFLTLVETSEALVGNEVKNSNPPVNPPAVISPRPPRPVPAPRRRKSHPPVVKIIPVDAATASADSSPAVTLH